MRTAIENGQAVVIETRDYMGKPEAPIYGTFRGMAQSSCVVELADGTKKFVAMHHVQTAEDYAKTAAARNSKPVPVANTGLASDAGQAYDWYER